MFARARELSVAWLRHVKIQRLRDVSVQWQVSRWGRGDPKPLFGVYLFAQDASKRVMAKSA